MSQNIDGKAAAEALSTVQDQQQRVTRAVRLPWWVYAAMFVITVGSSAATDFVTLSGAKVMAAVVLGVLVVVLAVTFVGRVDILGRARGVERRQQFSPPVFLLAVVVGSVGTWLLDRFGTGFENGLAKAVGMSDYPGTVSGVVYGAVFTGLFALVQVLVAADQRKAAR